MATGDTIAGEIDVVRVDTSGETTRVAGPYSADDVDINADLSPEQKLYINTSKSDRVDAPLQAREVTEDDPIPEFLGKETLRVRHKARATVANDIDHDADAFAVSVLIEDNRGRIRPKTLSVSDQELTADVTEDDTEFTGFFEWTVNENERARLLGSFEASAVEN